MKRNCWLAVLLCGALGVTACSSSPEPETKKGPEKPTEPAGPITGKEALLKMYKLGYAWARDLTLLSLESKQAPGVKIENGKAAIWTATFASPALAQVRTFTYATADKPPDIRKGLDTGHAIPWGGTTREVLPVPKDFPVDSDAAFKTAAEIAGAWLTKNADKDVTMTLGNASRFPTPVWYVLWGDNKSGFYAVISDVTGKPFKK